MVAATAGICEEVIFRGVMLYEFEHLPFELSAVAMIVIAGILFGIVHLYQGLKGVIGTAYIGGVFFYIYLITGNLWICIIIHFLFDVKFAFTPNKGKENAGAELSVE
ncbi:CPBP family intramembrane glutamic endopeptidase [Actinomycetes bacterium NPDC127524]